MSDSDPHFFSPVPVAARDDGWTPERQGVFIRALADCACVTEAARSVGMSREGAYRLRRRADAAAFRAAWDAALALSYDRLEEAALGRALHGVPVPIVHGGEQVAERRHFDERLTVYLLKRRDDRLLQEALRRKKSFVETHREWLADALHKALGRLGSPSR